MMTRTITIMMLILISTTSSYSSSSRSSYVEEACSVTRYRSVCIRSMAPFSRVAGSSPSRWARAGVSVTLSESSNLTRFLTRLMARSSFGYGTRDRVALSDCVECFRDSVDSLHLSLGVVRNLEVGKFEAQMGDLTTWLSAALTNGETCLDGFGVGGGGSDVARRRKKKSEVEVVKGRVRRVGYVTSNALALVNKLASTGLEVAKPSTSTSTKTSTSTSTKILT